MSQPSDFRAKVRYGLDAVLSGPEGGLTRRVADLIDARAVFDVACPVDRLEGPEAILEGFILPLRRAMTGLRSRDEILIGGKNARTRGGTWIAALTHYVGTFSGPLFGLRPSGRLAFLRSGEFYQIEGGRIVEAKIIVDLPDLARQAGRPPFPPMLGTEMLFPGPATHDGVCPRGLRGPESLALIERMLGDLHDYDADGGSAGQTGPDGYWHEEMLWYGPGGIGATYRWDGFVDDHRAAFLSAFPDRTGGNHFCRLGDGNYAAVAGWPSMRMTHEGAYLGVPASGKPLTLRVMDFYRCDHGGPAPKIAENWVCLDYGDLFRQMGVDLIARANALP